MQKPPKATRATWSDKRGPGSSLPADQPPAKRRKMVTVPESEPDVDGQLEESEEQEKIVRQRLAASESLDQAMGELGFKVSFSFRLWANDANSLQPQSSHIAVTRFKVKPVVVEATVVSVPVVDEGQVSRLI